MKPVLSSGLCTTGGPTEYTALAQRRAHVRIVQLSGGTLVDVHARHYVQRLGSGPQGAGCWLFQEAGPCGVNSGLNVPTLLQPPFSSLTEVPHESR